MTASPPVQLLVYRFGAGARYEGQLVGALERMESGGALRILEALFISRDAETRELAAVDLRGRGAGSMVGPLIGFRLEGRDRARATEKAFATGGDALRALGEALAPGDALAAVVVEHTWTKTLDDAITRTGGTEISSDFVDPGALADLPALVAAAGRSREADRHDA